MRRGSNLISPPSEDLLRSAFLVCGSLNCVQIVVVLQARSCTQPQLSPFTRLKREEKSTFIVSTKLRNIIFPFSLHFSHFYFPEAVPSELGAAVVQVMVYLGFSNFDINVQCTSIDKNNIWRTMKAPFSCLPPSSYYTLLQI